MNMVCVLLLCWMCNIPHDGVLHDTIDLVEVNHCYSVSGKLNLDQVIYYEWSNLDNRFNVVAWRLIHDCRGPSGEFLGSSMVPNRQANGSYQAVWYDGGTLRCVTCPRVLETWTQYDPELLDRKFLPMSLRYGLCKPLAQ